MSPGGQILNKSQVHHEEGKLSIQSLKRYLMTSFERHPVQLGTQRRQWLFGWETGQTFQSGDQIQCQQSEALLIVKLLKPRVRNNHLLRDLLKQTCHSANHVKKKKEERKEGRKNLKRRSSPQNHKSLQKEILHTAVTAQRFNNWTERVSQRLRSPEWNKHFNSNNGSVSVQ